MFKGTQKVHEVIWDKNSSFLQFRSLTCTQCPSTEICSHYALGEINLEFNQNDNVAQLLSHDLQFSVLTQTATCSRRLRYSDVYSDSENEDSEIIQGTNDQENSSAVKNEDYVLVAIHGKRKIQKHCVGKVLVTNDTGNYTVNLMTKVKRVKAFVFPNNEVISIIKKEDLVQVFSLPTMNKKGQYTFNENFSIYHDVR